MSRTAINLAVEAFVDGTRNPNSSYDDVYRQARTILEHAPYADHARRQRALDRLADSIAGSDGLSAAIAAVTAGALIEEWAIDPAPVAGRIAELLCRVVAGASDFARSCAREYGDALGVAGAEAIAACAQQLVPRLPREARDWAAFDLLAPAAVAVLARVAELRARLQADQPTHAHIGDLAAFHETAATLRSLLSILDDEILLVLVPDRQRGFRVRISGIVDNFQLHTLLADALVGEGSAGGLPGERLDPRVVAAARDSEVDPAALTATATFNLLNWRGLLPDGRASGSPDGWIPHQGSPADIELFEAERVILLGPLPHVRQWDAGRLFSSIDARLDLVETLPLEAVQDWLERVAAANRPDR